MSNLKSTEHKIEGYERVVEFTDAEAGLHAIIVLHDTRLGPALGGTRVYPYATFDEALNDALRLAKGMTYKAAVAETGTSGGKSVIIADYKAPKPDKLLLAFAEAVNTFEGRYICAEDFGMLVSDLDVVRRGTHYVVGLPHPGSSGDPSYFTAFGGFRGVQATAQHIWGSSSLEGKTVAVQGLGSVGMKLAEQIFWAGGKLIVADINQEAVKVAVQRFGAQAVEVTEILKVECDILAPCALGAIVNPDTIPHLKCKGIAGLANNQLLTDADGQALSDRGILYAPDYVINSGGLFNVCTELEPGGYHPAVARKKTNRIYDLLLTIFTLAEERKLSTTQVAKDLAEYNLERGIGKRTEDVVYHH